jgi:mono/diheme cytochrome c family protein
MTTKKDIFRRVAAVLAGLALVAGALLSIYVARTWNRTWEVPAPDLHASRDPDAIRRGEYLVYGPAHCVECHAATSADAEPAVEGVRLPLVGGRRFAAPGLGVVYAKNLTPDAETGIGRYSDGEIARMLRYSVRPDGKASIRLLMPYQHMSDDDLVAILSFLRAQSPVRHEVPANSFTLMGKVVKSFAPVFLPRTSVVADVTAPPSAPTRERGEYIARSVANCGGCHTMHDPVTLANKSAEFAGGEEFEPSSRPGADRTIWFRTPNLTPARGSALAKFPDRATFVARFQRGGRHLAGSPMPWECFGRMNDNDLGALYEFLHSLEPATGPAADQTTFRKAG